MIHLALWIASALFLLWVGCFAVVGVIGLFVGVEELFTPSDLDFSVPVTPLYKSIPYACGSLVGRVVRVFRNR